MPARPTPVLAIVLAALLAASALPAAVHGQVAQLQIRDSLALAPGVGESLRRFVDARDAGGADVLAATELTYAVGDTSIVVMNGDTAYALRPGSTRIAVTAVGADGRVLGDTVVIGVEDAAGAAAGYEASYGAEPVEAGLAALPDGAVLAVEPDTVRLLRFETATLRARARGADGDDLGPVGVAWKSLTPAIVAVTPAGDVTGIGVGRGSIVATTAGGQRRTVPVDVDGGGFRLAQRRLVLPERGFLEVDVVVPSQGDRPIANRKGLRWETRDRRVAVVSPLGRVTGVARGRTTVVATGFGRAVDSVDVVVHAPVAFRIMTPNDTVPVVLAVGDTEEFSVRFEAADGSPVEGIGLDWHVADTTVARFDTTTRTLATRRLGATRVRARPDHAPDGSRDVVWEVRVVPFRIALDRARLALSPGAQAQLAAAVLDREGRRLGPLEDAEWRSSRPAVAEVDAEGTVSARGRGRAWIHAEGPGGRRDSAIVFVAGPLLVVSAPPGAAPRLAQVDPARAADIVPLELAVDSVLAAAYSPDRTRIAVAAYPRGGDTLGLALYVVDADGGGQTQPRIRRLNRSVQLGWTPDGESVIYTHPVRKDSIELRSIALATNRQATLAASTLPPMFDVAALGIVLRTGSDGSPDLVVANADGSGRRLVPLPSKERREHPQLLADRRVVYATSGGGGAFRHRVVEYDLAGGGRRVVCEWRTPILALAVPPDGGSLAFVAAGASRDEPARLVLQRPMGRTVAEVPLAPGERVLGLSF
jgi:hypothetical protein